MRQLISTIVLAVIAFASFSHVAASEQKAEDAEKLSPAFSQSALTALAQIHRWKEKARLDAKGTVPSPTFGKVIKVSALENVTQARIAATTDGDKRASEALQALYSKVDAWTGKLIQARANLDATHAVDPDSVDKDEDLLKISECERSYHTMLGNGTYLDLPSCH
jgi:hypothetical protein